MRICSGPTDSSTVPLCASPLVRPLWPMVGPRPAAQVTCHTAVTETTYGTLLPLVWSDGPADRGQPEHREGHADRGAHGREHRGDGRVEGAGHPPHPRYRPPGAECPALGPRVLGSGGKGGLSATPEHAGRVGFPLETGVTRVAGPVLPSGRSVGGWRSCGQPGRVPGALLSRPLRSLSHCHVLSLPRSPVPADPAGSRPGEGRQQVQLGRVGVRQRAARALPERQRHLVQEPPGLR